MRRLRAVAPRKRWPRLRQGAAPAAGEPGRVRRAPARARRDGRARARRERRRRAGGELDRRDRRGRSSTSTRGSRARWSSARRASCWRLWSPAPAITPRSTGRATTTRSSRSRRRCSARSTAAGGGSRSPVWRTCRRRGACCWSRTTPAGCSRTTPRCSSWPCRTSTRRGAVRGRWWTTSSSLPLLGDLVRRCGAVHATPANAERLLALEHAVIAFPEGTHGIGKPYAAALPRAALRARRLRARRAAHRVAGAAGGDHRRRGGASGDRALRTGSRRLLGLPYLPLDADLPLARTARPGAAAEQVAHRDRGAAAVVVAAGSGRRTRPHAGPAFRRGRPPPRAGSGGRGAPPARRGLPLRTVPASRSYAAAALARGAGLRRSMLPFLPALGAEFLTFDDDAYVSANRFVLQGLTPASVRHAFTTFSEGNYHPLTWLSLMLDAQLFGDGPAGFHLTSLAAARRQRERVLPDPAARRRDAGSGAARRAAVGAAPAARRVGGVDQRAQGRAEHAVRPARDPRLPRHPRPASGRPGRRCGGWRSGWRCRCSRRRCSSPCPRCSCCSTCGRSRGFGSACAASSRRWSRSGRCGCCRPASARWR